MEELEKLHTMVEHWIEHNAEHMRTYQHWAERADVLGRPELSDILRQIAYEAEGMEVLLKKALDASA